MEREKIKRLNWFLLFLNYDLEKTSVAKYQQLEIEAGKHLTVGKHELLWDSTPPEQSPLTRKILTTDENPKQNTLRCNLTDLQIAFKKGTRDFFYKLEHAQTNDIFINNLIDERRVALSVELWTRKEKQTDSPTFELQEKLSGDIREIFIFQFLRCLSSVPLTSFHKCQGCSNWFVNASKAKKRFCTNQCASRHNIRKKRKDPHFRRMEKEKAKKREKKSYAEKIFNILKT